MANTSESDVKNNPQSDTELSGGAIDVLDVIDPVFNNLNPLCDPSKQPSFFKVDSRVISDDFPELTDIHNL